MLKSNHRLGMLVLSLAAVFVCAVASDALAAKKVSYEEAWTKCKAEIGANVPASDTTTSAARATAGAGCMKKYGYRLKK